MPRWTGGYFLCSILLSYWVRPLSSSIVRVQQTNTLGYTKYLFFLICKRHVYINIPNHVLLAMLCTPKVLCKHSSLKGSSLQIGLHCNTAGSVSGVVVHHSTRLFMNCTSDCTLVDLLCSPPYTVEPIIATRSGV